MKKIFKIFTSSHPNASENKGFEIKHWVEEQCRQIALNSGSEPEVNVIVEIILN